MDSGWGRYQYLVWDSRVISIEEIYKFITESNWHLVRNGTVRNKFPESHIPSIQSYIRHQKIDQII